ncbi:hypothetical protein Dsin_000670 [Dipteronia sinensis]|uniref:Uncharacterized protein n=1 Tax=Dipteronia sinensis TaxID=43782 RepID=A0AAE0EI04_9ROSI|nr:hypothetical protein Dsin_000670 [Dipteronia sinensis]
MTFTHATSFEEISLPINFISGTIGNGIVHLENITVLELYSNKFTGMIPIDIVRLTKLKHLLLHINNLSGSLHPSMKNCTNLTTLNLLEFDRFEEPQYSYPHWKFQEWPRTDDENLTFSSDEFQNLQVLGLGDCQLYGQLPA